MATFAIEGEFLPGDRIEKALAEASRIATLMGCRVRFEFNGVHFSVNPDADINKGIDYFHATLKSDINHKFVHC